MYIVPIIVGRLFKFDIMNILQLNQLEEEDLYVEYQEIETVKMINFTVNLENLPLNSPIIVGRTVALLMGILLNPNPHIIRFGRLGSYKVKLVHQSYQKI